MADFKEIPTPTYDYEISRLVKAYQKAIDNILQELNRLDLDSFSRANQVATLKSISEILTELDSTASKLAEEYIEKAVTEGIINTILALGVVDTVSEAQKIVSFNRINKELVKAAIADTQSDLLAVSQNVSRKVQSTVRQVSAEVMRNNLPQGVNATATLRRDIVAELRKQLGESVNTGIIDNAGRRWRPTTYVDMLVRTKMMQAHRESTINEGVSRGALYGVVSTHGAKDACRNWEGKVLKLTPDAPGDYVYIGDVPRNELWHPNCKHQITAVRRPERYA